MSLQHSTIDAAPPITLATLQAGERVTVQVRPIASDSAAAVWIGTILAGPAAWQVREACRSILRVDTSAVRAKDGTWILTVACAHCGNRHQHGGGADAEPDLGGRSSHCVTGSGQLWCRQCGCWAGTDDNLGENGR